MGVLSEGINEVIATTRLNAAPMGVIFRNGIYRVVCFLGSHTAENISRDGAVVANLVHDPVMYVRTAFADLPDDAFVAETVGNVTVYRLRDAEAYVAFSAAVEQRGTQSMTVRLTPLWERIISARPRPVNRGFSGIIEATVHGTRYRVNRDPALKGLIDHHAGIVRKCGGPRELEALGLLEEFLKE
jgi:hypothetical protein